MVQAINVISVYISIANNKIGDISHRTGERTGWWFRICVCICCVID